MARRKIVVALGEMRYSLEKLLRGRSKKRWKNGGTTCENNGK